MADRVPTTEEIEASVARSQAEAVKFLAEAEAARVTAESTKTKLEVETRTLAAGLIKAEADAQSAVSALKGNEINLRQMERQEEAALATDLFHQIYFFTDDVNERSVHAAIDRLAYWHRTRKNPLTNPDGTPHARPGQPCDIEIVFSSPGGSVFEGFVLFDFIQELKRQGHFITTGTLGMAASMAGILLQVGDVRYCAKEAWLLMHEISTLAWGKSSIIEDEVEFVKRIQKRVISIFLDGNTRALHNGTATKKLTRIEFEKSWKRKDWWADSDEALKLGFVDQIR